MNNVLCSIIFVLSAYTILPNFYFRNISKSVIKKFETQKKVIALTFDDGPDKEYTPILLDLLKKYNIKCTFFVVAEKAHNNKHIIDRMLSDGHSIGLHSLKHQSAWLSFPWKSKNDFNLSLGYMSELGIKPEFFRPPWGTFNQLTHYYANKNNLNTVLWSINASDWSKGTTTDDIIDKVTKNIKPGDILVLHDSNGAEGAPLRTISALDKILPQLLDEGYEFITLHQLNDNIHIENTKKIV